jgi:predicted RNA-binding Zn-ribbon protein involved in translation (DUF1610 family)
MMSIDGHARSQTSEYSAVMYRCPACSFEFEVPSLSRRMELRKVDHPKPLLSEIRKVASEVDCPNCKASLRRIYRFKNLRHLGTLIVLVTVTLVLLGVFSSSIAIQVLLPLMLLVLAGRIWDDTYPRIHL